MLLLLVIGCMICGLLGVGVLIYMNSGQAGGGPAPPTTPERTPKPGGPTKPTKGPSGGGNLSKSEVRKHNKQGDCWVILNNTVYDLSSFDHPGGASRIKCGTDDTSKFKSQHGSGKNQLRQVTKLGPVSG